jgi:hypothetical protein
MPLPRDPRVYCPPNVPCGRPLVVGGAARVAELVPQHAPAGDDPLAAALADAWIHDALAEHASIAAFARFSLELLAVGAPAELVADAQRAALDETKHARLCFAMAARHGRACSAGALPMDGMCIRTGLAEIAGAAAEEGCVGEAFAAVVLAHAAALAEDPELAGALSTMAADEARHAELAWRFVAWAVGRGGAEVRRAVERGLAEGRARLPESVSLPTGVAEPVWRATGRLAPHDLARCLADHAETMSRCERALARS